MPEPQSAIYGSLGYSRPTSYALKSKRIKHISPFEGVETQGYRVISKKKEVDLIETLNKLGNLPNDAYTKKQILLNSDLLSDRGQNSVNKLDRLLNVHIAGRNPEYQENFWYPEKNPNRTIPQKYFPKSLDEYDKAISNFYTNTFDTTLGPMYTELSKIHPMDKYPTFRAYMYPKSNKIHVSPNASVKDYLAEESHSVQDISSLRDIKDKFYRNIEGRDYESDYKTKGTIEYEAHNIIQPNLQSYIDGFIPADRLFEYIQKDKERSLQLSGKRAKEIDRLTDKVLTRKTVAKFYNPNIK